MREVRTNGRVSRAILAVYDECKYTASEEVFKNAKEINYRGLTKWVIVTGKDAEAIEAETDGSSIDDCHEYLELHFEDGTTSTFRNSYVDLFVI